MFSIANEDRHLLINGENIAGLKLINGLRYFDFMLIDPPYNSKNKNNEGFKYNDNFGDKWSEEIEQRLIIAKEMLNDTGAIAVHIGEEEYPNLRNVMNNVFGKSNYVNTFVLKRIRKNLTGLKKLPKGFEFLLVYSKTSRFMYKNPYMDSPQRRKEGYWTSFHNNSDRPNMRYDIEGITITEGHWKWCQERGLRALTNYQEYEKEYSETMTLRQYWDAVHEEYEEMTGSKMEFVRKSEKEKIQYWVTPSETSIMDTNMIDWLANEIHGKKTYGLETVKNLKTTTKIIDMFTDKNSKICDFYAGSGTTGQAVLELNHKDGGNRVVTLITNNESNICSGICYPRMREVCKTYNKELTYMVLE